jgi:hypothetical protein
MFKQTQYRAKETKQSDLANDKASTLAVLADNEQWVTDNYDKTVTISERDRSKCVALTAEEDTVLRCLGAALIMQWNTLPAKLQRELFDDAGDMGALWDTSALRGQIARFLHTHKNDQHRRGQQMIKSKLGTREEDRRTEDEIAREKLGPRGVPGAPDSAKLTPQENKNIPKSGEFDGHTA